VATLCGLNYSLLPANKWPEISRHMKKKLAAITCVLLTACCALAAGAVKSKIKVAKDGFPVGHDQPEGAACDLARAFIKHDAALFTNTCIKPYASNKGPADYAKFLQLMAETMKKDATRKKPFPESPQAIGKVFAARHPSSKEPAAYGAKSYGFQDLMFVDVDVLLRNGKHSVNRTLVIKWKDGKWYAHPMPTVGNGLLGKGINEEKASEKDFSNAYVIQK
jgi:hypothetical protein